MKRIFLVGSGPSLVNTPWELLKREDLMVMNKFGRMDTYHGWGMRPKYYFKIDHNTVDRTQVEEITWGLNNCEHLFLWDMFRTGYPERHPNYETLSKGVGDIPNTTWIEKCPEKCRQYYYDNHKATTEWHMPTLCTAFGGMSTMIQIASMWLGYDEIYLLGCDLGYTPEQSKNHAIPNYTIDKRDKSALDNGNMLHLHKMAKRCCPVPIYNSTVGGELEVYERRDIWEVLSRPTQEVVPSLESIRA